MDYKKLKEDIKLIKGLKGTYDSDCGVFYNPLDNILEFAQQQASQLELVPKIAEVVKPFAMAFDDLKATRLHPEDDEFQKWEDDNLVIPTKGLNSGHFRKIWELYNQLSNFPA